MNLFSVAENNCLSLEGISLELNVVPKPVSYTKIVCLLKQYYEILNTEMLILKKTTLLYIQIMFSCHI